MITLKSIGGGGLSCTNGEVTLHVFPPEAKAMKGGEKSFVLLGSPQDQATASVLSWPGEYDVQGMAIRGVGQREGQQVSYVVIMDGVRLGFLSAPLGSWSEDELGALGDLDVLALPAEDAKQTVTILEEVDPRVLIPLPTKDLKTFEAVLHAAGAGDAKPQKEVKLKGGSLPQDSRAVYVLEPQK